MRYLSFTKALPVFALSLTVIYVFLLLRSKDESEGFRISRKIYSNILLSTYILATIGISLTLAFDFRESLAYYTIVTFIILSLIILSLQEKSKRQKHMLLSILIMWHLIMLWDRIPSCGITLLETSHMIRDMLKGGRWEYSWAHNPAYNPLPTTSFTIATLTYVTSLPWHNFSLWFFFYFIFMISYDLTIYGLTERITGSTTAGIFAVLLLGLTPETNLLMHSFQWPANLLVLISILTLIRTLGNGINHEDIVLSNLCYVSAILTHPTAGIMIFLPPFILLFSYLLPKFRTTSFKIASFPSILTSTLHSSLVKGFFIFLSIFTLTRAMWAGGYMEYIVPMLSNFVREMFLMGEPSERIFTPLYDRSGVNFIQAYSWALAVSLASALVLVEVIKRRMDFWHLVLYAASATFILAGFLIGFFFKTPASTAMYRAAYTAMPLMFPLAALGLARLLNNGRAISIVTLLTIILASPIAIQDPNISPREYGRVRGWEYTYVSPPDYLHPTSVTPLDIKEAQTLLLYLQSSSKIITYSSNFFKRGVGGRLGVWKTEYTNSLKEALKMLAYMHNYNLPEIDIILNFEKHNLFNKIYDGRSIIYCLS